MSEADKNMMTFGDHLEVLRRLIFRVLGVTTAIAIAVFSFKGFVFDILLAPSEHTFITYQSIEHLLQTLGCDFHFEPFNVELIATDLSSQFMTHIKTSFTIALLIASPYILIELFGFASPALYDNEKNYTIKALFIVYFLFFVGVAMSYFILFPISFRFLGTYSVADKIKSTITLDSYISTFTTLTFVMGLVFQLPVIAFVLAKLGIIDANFLTNYRKHAFIVIMVVAALITPPDLMTLILVTLPLYLLYEVSIQVVKRCK